MSRLYRLYHQKSWAITAPRSRRSEPHPDGVMIDDCIFGIYWLDLNMSSLQMVASGIGFSMWILLGYLGPTVSDQSRYRFNHRNGYIDCCRPLGVSHVKFKVNQVDPEDYFYRRHGSWRLTKWTLLLSNVDSERSIVAARKSTSWSSGCLRMLVAPHAVTVEHRHEKASVYHRDTKKGLRVC